jgi:hypothetical protein
MEWVQVEPVLQATYRLLNTSGEDSTTQDAVCNELGKPRGDDETIRALAQLAAAGYIGGMTIDNSPAPVFIEATEKGLRRASGWPSESDRGGEILLGLLDERIANPVTTDDERGRLERARSALADVAPRLIGEVLAAYTARVIPPTG